MTTSECAGTTPMITFHLQKTSDPDGLVSLGAFDNDLAVLLRNASTGSTMNFPQVSCAGRTTCSFAVAVTTLISSLGLSGTDYFEGDITSPYVGGIYVGTTGTASLSPCD